MGRGYSGVRPRCAHWHTVRLSYRAVTRANNVARLDCGTSRPLAGLTRGTCQSRVRVSRRPRQPASPLRRPPGHPHSSSSDPVGGGREVRAESDGDEHGAHDDVRGGAPERCREGAGLGRECNGDAADDQREPRQPDEQPASGAGTAGVVLLGDLFECLADGGVDGVFDLLADVGADCPVFPFEFGLHLFEFGLTLVDVLCSLVEFGLVLFDARLAFLQ